MLSPFLDASTDPGGSNESRGSGSESIRSPGAGSAMGSAYSAYGFASAPAIATTRFESSTGYESVPGKRTAAY